MTDGDTAQPRILILGARGQVGVELQRSFAGYGSITAADIDTVDLTDPEQTRALSDPRNGAIEFKLMMGKAHTTSF